MRTSPLRVPALLCVVPLTVAAVLAWPLLALASVVPFIGLVSLPSLFSCTVSILVLLPTALYLAFAQPYTRSRAPLLPSFPPLLSEPLRAFHLVHHALLVLYDLWSASIFSLVLDSLTKRVLLLGGRDSAHIVRENLVYLEPAAPHYPDAKRLDVYLAARTTPAADEWGVLRPVVLLLAAPSYRLAGLKSFPGPTIALRLRQLGYCVVVPALTPFDPSDPRVQEGKAIERMVAETRECLKWIAQNVERYGGDAEKVVLMGYGAGAHVASLTLIQSAVVAARETYHMKQQVRDKARRKKEERLSVDPEGGASSGTGTPKKHPGDTRPPATVSTFPSSSASTSPRLHSSYTSAARHTVHAHSPAYQHLHEQLPATYSDSAPSSDADDIEALLRASRTGAQEVATELKWAAGDGKRSRKAVEDSDDEGEGARAREGASLPLGVRACPLWTLSSVLTTPLHAPSPAHVPALKPASDEPEARGESLARCTIGRGKKARERRLAIRAVVVVGGVYDVVRQIRWEADWGMEKVSSLSRVCESPTRDILQACPSHLLYAASPLLTSSPSTAPNAPSSLLPSSFLILHGGRDPLVPFSQATLLRNLLVGTGLESENVRLRLCKEERGWGSLASLMHRTRYSPLVTREIENLVADACADKDESEDDEASVSERGRTGRGEQYELVSMQ